MAPRRARGLLLASLRGTDCPRTRCLRSCADLHASALQRRGLPRRGHARVSACGDDIRSRCCRMPRYAARVRSNSPTTCGARRGAYPTRATMIDRSVEWYARLAAAQSLSVKRRQRAKNQDEASSVQVSVDRAMQITPLFYSTFCRIRPNELPIVSVCRLRDAAAAKRPLSRPNIPPRKPLRICVGGSCIIFNVSRAARRRKQRSNFLRTALISR